jgi:hypothetical protein
VIHKIFIYISTTPNLSVCCLLSLAMSISWQKLVAEKKSRQAESVPKEWLITPPTDDVLDVTDVPAECGLLSARELEITTIGDVSVLLHKLATAEWSSVDVTTAFSKRAIVAHQVVCPFMISSANQGDSLIFHPSRQIASQRFSSNPTPSRGLPGSIRN